jgi:hypothetical protein
MTPFRATFALLALFLAGCANLTTGLESTERGIDGIACVGSVTNSNAGLFASDNLALLSKTQMPSDKGGVCAGKVFGASAPVVLYRVFDSSKPYTKFGNWWSLKPPGNSKAEYRAANAICPEWSNLDRLVSCEVRPGTQVVLGTTQSAQCADGAVYAKTSEIQVFVPNDGRVGIIHVGNCAAEASWP